LSIVTRGLYDINNKFFGKCEAVQCSLYTEQGLWKYRFATDFTLHLYSIASFQISISIYFVMLEMKTRAFYMQSKYFATKLYPNLWEHTFWCVFDHLGPQFVNLKNKH
jgi:hypothetical protein